MYFTLQEWNEVGFLWRTLQAVSSFSVERGEKGSVSKSDIIDLSEMFLKLCLPLALKEARM